MAWTTPRTDWRTGELVTASDMNAVSENLAALKHPPTAIYITTEDIFVDTDGEFADVDSDNMNLTITTSGGDVLVHFDCSLERRYVSRERDRHNTYNCFDIDVDGKRQGEDDGIIRVLADGVRRPTGYTRLIQNLSPGSHSFKLQCKNWQNGIRLYPGAQFWVREIS